MIKMISKWYFGSDDKEEVKKFSKEISVIFKINGYNPNSGNFFDFFEVDRFSFIPCIKQGLYETSDEDFADFEEEAANALDSAYDSSVNVTLDDLEESTKNGSRTVNALLKDLIESKAVKAVSFVDFIDSCGSEIQQKFVSWLFNNKS